MKVYLLDRNPEMVEAWTDCFITEESVEVLQMDFEEFMSVYDVECVVSPANSFGIMDGGYDAAITRWFGEKLQKDVQKHILENYFGEQPVGTSFLIDTPQKGVKLIHTPSMRVPERILDSTVVYQCMRTCLMAAYQNGIQSIVIPAFGGCTGGIPAKEVARMMYCAWLQIQNPPGELSWDYALETHIWFF